jgi:hypothetical protein
VVELGKTRVDVVGVDLLDKVRPRSARSQVVRRIPGAGGSAYDLNRDTPKKRRMNDDTPGNY